MLREGDKRACIKEKTLLLWEIDAGLNMLLLCLLARHIYLSMKNGREFINFSIAQTFFFIQHS